MLKRTSRLSRGAYYSGNLSYSNFLINCTNCNAPTGTDHLKSRNNCATMPSGSCLCHKLKYEYTTEPLTMARNVSLPGTASSLTCVHTQATCHCLSCRKITGGTNSVNLLVPEDKIRVTGGSTKQYTETHENGKKLTVYFCGECGSVIYKQHESFPGSAVILAGTLDDPEGLEKSKPQVELYAKHRVSWLPVLAGAEQKPEF